MKIKLFGIMCMVSLVALLTVSGCVAPPEASTTGPVDLYDPNQFKTGVTSDSGTSPFVTEATPFITPALLETQGYSVIATRTRPPDDISCLINLIEFDWRFNPNKTAFAFDLKNPPLYMNYSITKPFNVKGERLVTDKTGKEKMIKYEYPAPYSYLDITIRDRATGEIYLQDGYGRDFGYYTNNTDLRLLKSGDMLIEVSGFNVSGAVGFWAKPNGNFDESVSFDNVECVYWVRSSQI